MTTYIASLSAQNVYECFGSGRDQRPGGKSRYSVIQFVWGVTLKKKTLIDVSAHLPQLLLQGEPLAFREQVHQDTERAHADMLV